jgi:MYXO-CTERM domain-containing protein
MPTGGLQKYCMEEEILMKSIFRLSALLLLASSTALAQNDRPASDARTDNALRNEEGREHHNYGWIGLLGLAGLAGLRRKSEMQSRLESQGVNVKTVRT